MAASRRASRPKREVRRAISRSSMKRSSTCCWKVWNFTTVRLGLMLARISPTIFSKPGIGRLVWITRAPAYMDWSFSRGLSGSGETKAMADRVAAAEELLDEFLVDHRDRRRVQRVLQREAAAHDDVGANRVEVLRRALHPGCTFVQVRFALNLYARSPIVLLHWRIGREADFENTGNGVEAVYDGPIEGLDLCVLIAGRLRIDVGDIAVRCVQFHVHVLGLVETLGKEARGNEQHEGERGLHYHQCTLQEGRSVSGRTRVGGQGFSGLRARRHQRWRKAKEDSCDERKRKREADDQRRGQCSDRHVLLIGKGELQQKTGYEIGESEAEQPAHT